MNLLKASSGSAVSRSGAFLLLVAALLQGGAAFAQCTVNGTISKFEPNPGGVTRPSFMNWIGIDGFFLNKPSGGQARLLVSEAFGYHQVDLSDPQSPQALGWEDYRFSPQNPGPIPCNGDCHSSISAYGISDDGARAGFVLNTNQSSPYHVVIGSTGGTGWQVALKGDMPPGGGNAIAIQHVGSRYLAYTFNNSSVYVSDVTNLPGSLSANNLAVETIAGAPGGSTPALAGPYLVYMTSGFPSGGISLINVGTPGPAGSIGSGFSTSTIAVADWGRPAGEKPYAFHAAADPANGSAIYVLAEFANAAFQSAGYSLIRYVGGQATVVGTYRIPAVGGELWGLSYTVGLHQTGGSLFALMWGSRSAPSAVFRLFSMPVTAFGAQTPGTIDVDPAVYAGFGTGRRMAGLDAQNKLFLYVPSGNSGWVIPTTCVSTTSPAVVNLSASAYSVPLSSGATVFLGDQVNISAVVAPAPAQQPLTGFGWNFDFDFHSGNAIEDAGTTPRIKNNDNSLFGSPTNPPTTITLTGPCDPKANGDPSGGAGCWNSVKTNAAAGGPDFLGTETAGTSKSLTFAMEANNQYGSGGTSTFALNWKVPAARLATTQILAGGSLASASDGHPSAYQWAFGPDAQSITTQSCTTAACAPPAPYNTKGTYGYSLTTKYWPDQAFATTTVGTFTVTDFAPVFTVNGSATGPITAITNSQLSVANNSQRGAGVTGSGGYFYNLCASPCGADNYASWGTMGDTGSANIAVPGTPGTYLLKIRVNYTGTSTGTAYWPDPANVGTFTLNVSNVVPEVAFNCPQGGGPGGAGCDFGQTTVYTGDQIAAYAYSQGAPIATPPDSWSMPGASPSSAGGVQGATFSYGSAGNYTVTMTGYGTQATGTIHVNARTSPISVSAFGNPTNPAVGANVSFNCSASGGTGSFTSYSWNFGDGSGSSTANPNHSYQNAGTVTATCTVTDSGGHQGSGQKTLNVGGGGGGSCNVLNLFHSTDGQFPDPSGFPGAGFSIGWGTPITFIANSGYGSYSWNFGDGQLGTGQTVTHTYAQASVGNRTIALTVDGCTKSYPISVTGSAAPTLNCSGTTFAVQGATYQAQDQFGTPAGWRGVGVGASAVFVATNPSAATPSAYDWNWGDGTLHGSGQTASHAYANAGTYVATLTISASDTAGASGSCISTLSIIVEGPSGAFLSRYEDGTVFVASNVMGYKNVVFTASDPPANADAYSWDFGDGSSHGSGQVVTHSFAPGDWTVQLTVTKGLGSAVKTQGLTVVAPPEPPKWVVPGMAYVLGQVPGTTWQSDVTIFNPDPTRTATYSIAFLDARHAVDDISKINFYPVQVPALGSVASANLLGGVFGQPLGAYGALMIRGDVAPAAPVVTARTFNNGDASKGTFGLSVPSASVTGGVSSQASPAASVLIGLRQNEGANTNIGLVNLKNDWPKVQLDFVDGLSASPLASMTVDLQPYQAFQVNKALQAAGYALPSDQYTVKVKILQGGAVYPYATVIDLASTDPIVVTPSESPSNSYRVPGIVRLPGANGERWRSRFTIGNPSLTSRHAHVKYSYVPCDGSGCRNRVTIEGDLSMEPGQSLWADDFVSVWLMNSAGIAVSDTTSYQSSFLDVTPAAGDANQEPLVVLGETYNATPNGHVGLQIPGYTPQDGASRTGANKRLVLTGLASTESYRTNLALFVVAGASGKWVNVHVYSPQGTKLRDVPVLVDGFAQIGNGTLFGGLSGDLSRLSIVVDNLDDGVTVGGYATIIDNRSGDATFVKAQPAP